MLQTPLWKAVRIVAAMLIILFIGFSQIFVGDHYLTDVLAGYGLGLALAGFVYTSMDLLARRTKNQPV